MQVNEYDFKLINMRLAKLESEIKEFKSWFYSRFPKMDSFSDKTSAEFHEPLTDNDPEE